MISCLQSEHRDDNDLTFILLYPQYYIYKARCKDQLLILSVFRRKLEVMYRDHNQKGLLNKEDCFKNDRSEPYWELINNIT